MSDEDKVNEEKAAALKAAEGSAKVAEENRLALEAEKAERSKVAEELEATRMELKKLQSKDMNFRRLEQMTQEEKDQLTEQELILRKKQEDLDDQLKAHSKAVKDDWRNAAIERYSRGDADKAKEIALALKDLSGEETDRISVEARVAKAAKLARKDNDDHVAKAFSFGGGSPEPEPKKNFADTPEGQSLAARLGMSISKKK